MGLKTDFSVKDADRIYGNAWREVLEDAKAVYFSDSGSNVLILVLAFPICSSSQTGHLGKVFCLVYGCFKS